MKKPKDKKTKSYKMPQRNPDLLKPIACLIPSRITGLQRWSFPKPDKPSEPVVFKIPPELIEEYLLSGQSIEEFLVVSPTTFTPSQLPAQCIPVTQTFNSANVSRDKTERLACEHMAKCLHGILEFSLEVGRIDVLTESTVFEVKQAHNWKHALGQVLVYGSYFPRRKKEIVLVGNASRYLDAARHHCSVFDVSVISFSDLRLDAPV